ncbi:MAG: hypothetical protein LBQ46_01465 [Treponema sp.]|nr:hypothetical protein [Treponema sp.]
MKNRILFGVPLVLCLFSLLGCNTGIDTGINTGDFDGISVVQVNAKELQEPVYDEKDYPAAAAVFHGENDFAFRLSAALAEQKGDNNLVCSPYSVWVPLAALVNAADARSKTRLLGALSVSDIDEADINRAASWMLYNLTNQRDKEYGNDYYHNPLRIANAIFAGNDVTLKRDFAQTFMDYYRGTTIQVDFGSPEAVKAVNNWASRNTDGLIPEIIQEFAPNTAAAIANAIYFSDRWAREFEPGNTREDVFQSPLGETEAFYMLREGDNQTYYEDDKVQAMPLRFLTAGEMYIILPKDGDAAGLLSSMTSEYFDEIRKNSFFPATGKLLLPRFSFASDVMNLSDTLTSLGVPLFDEPSLTGLIEGMSVQLSGALHKAVIRVDEKGTTAAAVTVIPGATSPGPGEPPQPKPFELICNKPFVFVLCGGSLGGNNLVLFTGIVNQP